MSDYMKEMERLVDAHEIAISRRLNGAAWNEETDASRAALLAHVAQRDHIEDVLGMVQSVELPEPDAVLCDDGYFVAAPHIRTSHEYNRAGWRLDVISISSARTYGDAREAAGYARGLKEADKLLLEAPRWRDVADELPQEAQEVLFVRSGKTVHGAWIGGIFWHNNQKMAAAYWMPLPNPLSAALAGEVKP